MNRPETIWGQLMKKFGYTTIGEKQAEEQVETKKEQEIAEEPTKLEDTPEIIELTDAQMEPEAKGDYTWETISDDAVTELAPEPLVEMVSAPEFVETKEEPVITEEAVTPEETAVQEETLVVEKKKTTKKKTTKKKSKK